jgi:tetratricopeptide (TPR) repeat protein
MLLFLPDVHLWSQNIQAERKPATDKEMLEKAKLDIFDRNWSGALKELEYLLKENPNSVEYASALFYKGWCLKELGQLKPALEAYSEYLKISTNAGLREEAMVAIIDLDFEFYRKGDNQYLDPVVGFLESADRMVRYYAAFKLSYVNDKKIAAKAVPVLKTIADHEKDEELVDRAKLALMRIAPEHLKELTKTKSIEMQMLHIHAYDKKLKKESFTITIPFALAKLALDSVPEKEKNMLDKKGYDVDLLLATLTKTRELVTIESDEVVFKIWID